MFMYEPHIHNHVILFIIEALFLIDVAIYFYVKWLLFHFIGKII